MADRELENKEQHPTYDEIQKRAYELHLARGGKDGQDIDDWFSAEDQLRREYNERVNDFAIEQEELTQVRAAEEIKESSTLPRTKTVAVGQQQNK